jgi:hypothetical protein
MAVRSWQVTFVFQNVVFSRSYCHLLQLNILNCPPPIAVSFCTANACSEVPFNRYASLTARGTLPPQSEWYYSHDQSRGLGAIVNIMSVGSTDTINITIEYGPDAMDASALNGVRSRAALFVALSRSYFSSQVHGAIRRALLAKANTDMDRYDWISIVIVLMSMSMKCR